MRKLKVKLLPNVLMLIKILCDDVTANWCVTCEYNKIVALDNIRTPDMFHRKNGITIWGDFASQYDEMNEFLSSHDRFGISLYNIFCIIIHWFLFIGVNSLDSISIIIQSESFVLYWNISDEFILLNVILFDLRYRYASKGAATLCTSMFMVTTFTTSIFISAGYLMGKVKHR